MTRLAVFVATVAYCGYFPVAPGTVGSAAGLAIFALVRATGSPLVEIASIVAVFAGGVASATLAERHFGGTDPGPVVIDEVAGMLVTLAFVPAGLAAAVAGFVIFRVYDVIKPYPANRLEHLHGGLGIMADDVMAGIYANLTLRALIWLRPGWLA